MAEKPQKDRWAAGRLTPAQLDAMLARLEGLPTSPAVAAAFLELLEGGLSGSPADQEQLKRDISNLARCDPVLTARLVSLAARSPGPAATAEAALGKLDIDVLSREAVTLGVWPEEDDSARGDVLPRRELWRHCVAVAWASRMIAERLPRLLDAEEAYTCGLLHDLGKLALDCCMPKSFRRAAALAATAGSDISPCERQVIGADHATIGRRLAELWRLPQTVIETIWLHHQPHQAIPPTLANAAMVQVVCLADAVARMARLGESGSYGPHMGCEEQARQLDLPTGALEEVSSRLGDEVSACCQLLDAAGGAARSRHRRALRTLIAKLAEANSQLRSGHGDLAARAEGFAQLQDFAGGLSERSTMADALGGVARLLAKVGGLQASSDEPVAAYAWGQIGEGAQVSCFDGGRSVWRALTATMEEAGLTADPAAIGPPAVAAMLGPEEIGKWVDVSTCRHLPLVCAGRWVGGVFFTPTTATRLRQQVLDATASAAAMTLAIVQGRCRAMLLSEQLAQASEELAATQEALAEAKTSTAIGEMATGAAHELNNPLAVISGRAQLMRDKAASPEERRVWSTIAEQAQRISDTITELMDLASPPPPRPARIDVAELLRAAAEEFSTSAHPQAAAAQVDIEVGEDSPPAWADPSQLRAVIVEAISNAATAATGRAHVRLTAGAGDEEGSVLITVADDGPGMDAQTLKRAFTPFFSVQRAGRRKGLGLPRARRYVENNAGKIRLTSRSGQGTTLHIQLPQG